MLLFTHFLKKYSPWLVLCTGVLLYVNEFQITPSASK